MVSYLMVPLLVHVAYVILLIIGPLSLALLLIDY